jgi:hypothetical protein
MACPEGVSTCLGGTEPAVTATGLWLTSSRVGSSGTPSLSVVVCSPPEACLEGNVCAPGYAGEQVRASDGGHGGGVRECAGSVG